MMCVSLRCDRRAKVITRFIALDTQLFSLFLSLKLKMMIFRYVGYARRIVHLEQAKGTR
jgi:hypothetical protein